MTRPTRPNIDRGDRRDSARLRAVDVEAVIADYVAGVATVDGICSSYRIGLSRLCRMLDDHHIPRRGPRRAPRQQQLPDALQAQIAEAYQAGETVAAIAARFGVSTSSVSNIGRRYYRVRSPVRGHDELVALAVAWFAGTELSHLERDALTRVGVRTRRHGLTALDGIDPELRDGLRDALLAEIERRWPPSRSAS